MLALTYLNINYQVINPLPKFEETKRALARGLYDFEEGDEDDLLHFKQVCLFLIPCAFSVFMGYFHLCVHTSNIRKYFLYLG